MELNRKHWTKAAWVHHFSLPFSLNKPTYLMSFCFQLNTLLTWKAGFLLPCLGKSMPESSVQAWSCPTCRHGGVMPVLQPGAWLTTNITEETSQKKNAWHLKHKVNKQNKTPKQHFCWFHIACNNSGHHALEKYAIPGAFRKVILAWLFVGVCLI